MENNKRRALGRGLEELFTSEQIDYDKIETKVYQQTSPDEIVNLPVKELRSNPYQPRKTFDEKALQELSNSIKEHGIIQPIIVKKSIKGYEIIAGERRVKASILAGLDTVPAIIRNFDDQDMMEVALLENLQREDLNAIEEAQAYKQILENSDLTQDELAKRLGKSRSHLTNMIGLLSLPDQVKELVINNKISMSHARVLSKLGNINTIIDLANKTVQDNLNVRDLEEIATTTSISKKQIIKKRTKNTEYQYVEEILKEKLGTKVIINNNKIVISFNNVNDLNRILEIMNDSNK
ncbi:MAG: ParB/RepB/Spo0J family partition protein [Tenericutes bacterium]|nr:ParB/RepB/Spo0J family partition protein [Mycoplasmatota bacterium]